MSLIGISEPRSSKQIGQPPEREAGLLFDEHNETIVTVVLLLDWLGSVIPKDGNVFCLWQQQGKSEQSLLF